MLSLDLVFAAPLFYSRLLVPSFRPGGCSASMFVWLGLVLFLVGFCILFVRVVASCFLPMYFRVPSVKSIIVFRGVWKQAGSR